MSKNQYLENVGYLHQKCKSQKKVEKARNGLNWRFWSFIGFVTVLIALAIWYALSLVTPSRDGHDFLKKLKSQSQKS